MVLNYILVGCPWSLLYIWTNCVHLFPILLYEEKIRSTGVSERAIAAYDRDGISFNEKRISQRAFTAEKKKKKKKKTVLELLKRHWRVSIVVHSINWTNPFDDLSSRANREWTNVVSTRSTGFRTNKRYGILRIFASRLLFVDDSIYQCY